MFPDCNDLSSFQPVKSKKNTMNGNCYLQISFVNTFENLE